MPLIHRVIEYSGLNFHEVMNLPCDMFQLMLKHSIVDELNSTEEGREYLDKCKRLRTKEIDLDALHKKYNM